MHRSTIKTLKTAALLAAMSLLAVAAIAAVRIATKPLDVVVETQIDILRKGERGWEKVDSVGPETLRFKASLVDLQDRKKIETNFRWSTKTKLGKPYAVRLLSAADLRAKPTKGALEANLTYQIEYDGHSARVPARVGTGAVNGPLGSVRGVPAKGLLGKEKTTFTMVSSNRFQASGAPEMRFVCRERFSLTPSSR